MTPLISNQPLSSMSQEDVPIEQRADVIPIPQTSELDIRMGAPIPNEENAWNAYNALTKENELGEVLPPEAKAKYVSDWTQYRDASKAYGLEVFPTQRQGYYKKRNEYESMLMSGLDKLPDMLEPEQKSALEARLKVFPEAERPKEIARTANFAMLQTAYGQPIKAEAYPALRDAFARQHLGLTDDTSDTAVYNALKTRHDQKKDAEANLNADLEVLIPKIIAGEEIDYKAHAEQYGKLFPTELAQATAQELRYRARQAKLLGKSVEPVALSLLSFIAANSHRPDAQPNEADQKKIGKTAYTMGDAAARFEALTPEQKEAVNTYIGARLNKAGGDPDWTIQRAAKAADGTVQNMAQNSYFFLSRLGLDLTLAKPEERDRLERLIQNSGFLSGKINHLRTAIKPTDAWYDHMTMGFTETLPYMVGASMTGGVGLAFTASSLAGQSYTQARLRNPAANDQSQFMAATVSGVAQTATEKFTSDLSLRALGAMPGFKTVFGKKFGSESFMRLTGITNKYSRFAAGAALGAATVGGVEYAEEIIQESTDRALQDLASLPTGITDDQGNLTTMGQNFKTVLSSFDPTSEKGSKLLLTLLPFALVGAKAGGFNSFRAGAEMHKNTIAMRSVGVPESIIKEIVNSPNVEKAEQLFQEVVSTELEIISKKAAEKYANDLADFSQKIEEAWAAQGIEIINPQFDDEGNVLAVDLQLPNETQTHPSVEAAQEALNEWAIDAHEKMMLSGMEAATAATVDFFTSDGQMNSSEEMGTRVKVNDFEGTFSEMMKRGIMSSDQMKERIKIFAMQKGISLMEAVALEEKGGIKVMAQNYAEEVGKAGWRYTVELFRGADPTNAAEDFSEAFWKHSVNSGILSPHKAIGWIRQIESSTGNPYLAADYEHSSDKSAMPLYEALGALSREHLLHNFRNTALPTEFKEWVETMLSTLGTAWEWFKSLMRGKDLQAALDKGVVPRQFADLISDSAGLNEKARERRIKDREMTQAKSAWEDTGYKLSEWIVGKLLHPHRAAMDDNPIAGELRRIYDGLTTYKRNPNAKIGQIKNRKYVIAAEKFFAGRDEKVSLDDLRGSANEMGFQFETIADMLDAVEEAIFYGRESYTTHSGIHDSSFSLGETKKTTLVAQGGGNQVANATQSVFNEGEMNLHDLHNTVKNFYKVPISLAGAVQSIARVLKRAGAKYEVSKSAKSQSRYIQIIQAEENAPDVIYKIRISDHELPDKYSQDWNAQVYVNWKSRSNSLDRFGSTHWFIAAIEALKSVGLPLAKSDAEQLSRNIASQKEKDMALAMEFTKEEQRRQKENQLKKDTETKAIEWSKKNTPELHDKYTAIRASLEESDKYGVNALKGQKRKDAKHGMSRTLEQIIKKYNNDSSFSVSDRTTVTPNADTQHFPTANGGLIGPASFSLGAWHGTPHKVEKFFLDKIGTGEGVQAYGWGLYFAENKNVAIGYRNALSSGEYVPIETVKKYFQEGSIVDSYGGKDRVIKFEQRENYNWVVTVESVEEINGKWQSNGRPRKHSTTPSLSKVKELGLETAMSGNLYRVNLKVEDEDLLDWDKPLSEQSEKVKNAIGNDIEGDYHPENNGGWSQTAAQYHREIEELAAVFEGDESEGLNSNMSLRFQRVRNIFLAAGIRGIRYLDGNSRADGKGSYNYVIFDEADIEILEENGTPVTPNSQGMLDSSFSLSARDTAYFAAVEAGDMVTAQEMVDAAAKKAGYAPHADFRDGHTAPGGSDIDQEVLDEVANPSLRQVRKGWDGVPSDYFHPINGPRFYMYNNKAGMESHKAITSKGKTMKVFRAVPLNVLGKKMEENDWVTPSKTYAIDHGEHRFGEGEYRIIEENVPESELFWDGNDINEWGISRKYRAYFKNTENNVKSADPITYDADSNVIPLSQRFDETKDSISYSLSAATQHNLQSVIEARLSRGPAERVAMLETMRTRMQGIIFKHEARAAGDLTEMEKQLLGWRGGDLTPAQAERLRIEDATALVKGIVSALPMDIRAKVSVPLNRILDADTELKTFNAFKELIQNADEVIEEELQSTYIERIADLLDTARPTSTPGLTNKTLLTPDTQRAIDQIDRIVEMSESDLARAEIATEADLAELESQVMAAQSDGDTALADEIILKQIDLQQFQLAMGKFGKLSKQSSSELAGAYAQLKDIYIRGRSVRKQLDEYNRNNNREIADDLKHALGYPKGVSGPQHDRATNAGKWKAIKQHIKAVGLEHMNVHEFLEVLFPDSFTVKGWSERAVKAMRGVKRRRLAAEKRYNDFFAARLDAKSNFARTKILEQLSERKSRKWEMNEVTRSRNEKIPVEYVPRILAGEMKLGWTDDKNNMTLLRQAWRDFTLLPEKQKSRTKTIKLNLPSERGNKGADYKSDLELLDVIMTYEQEGYRPALDRIGYTEEVMKQLKAALDPRALVIHEFLRAEYAAGWFDMNRVFQRVFNMDMPQIRNYAPGTFENNKIDNGKEAAGSLLGSAGATSAMGSGAVKNRRAHASRPLTINALSKYWAHTEQSAYWMEWTELIAEMSRALRSVEVRRAIEARHGKNVARDVDTWLEALNTDGSMTAKNILTMEKWISGIVNTQSHIALAFNLSVPFKQASAALGALTLVPAHSAAKTFAKLLFRWSEMKTIFDSEAIQQRIMGGISPESKSLMDATRLTPSKIMDLLSMGQLHTTLTDAAFTTISGYIAYDYYYNLARKQGSNPEHAEAFALDKMDYVVARTSQPADTQMKSLIEIKHGHGLMKLAIQFKSDMRRAMGAVLSGIMKHKAGTITTGDLSRIITSQWVVYGLLGALGTSIFKSIAHDDDDDKDPWQWENYALAALLGPLEGFVFVGTVAATVAKLGANALGADVPLFPSNANPLEKYISGGLNLILKDEFKASDLLNEKSFAEAVGMAGSAAGLPQAAIIPAIRRMITQIGNIANNAVTSPEEELMNYAREYDAKAKATAETAKEDTKDTYTKALAATGKARDEILAAIPDEKERRKVREKIKKHEAAANMNPLEQSLSKLGEEKRKEKAAFLYSKITNEEQKAAFQNRMKLLFDIDVQ